MPSENAPVAAPNDVPVLRSLGPTFDEELHGRHASVLLHVLTDRSASAPRNIALAGHYGSGKSSVVLGVQQGLDERKIEWVNLSLSSLGIDDTKRARVQDDGTLAPMTNLIQKEIVKQLLYRKAPKDMPGSRYFRIDSFRTGRALQWAFAAGLGVFAVAVLLGLVGRVEKVAPAWLAGGPAWGSWLAVGLLGAFMGVVCFLALRGFQSPVKVDSVSAGGAAVSLSAKENSYFDEYLDEIVYFFQRTKTQVAIFEDLDRFKDPHIFETLRELNTVLNHSEQVKPRPVRFVYAVRDSIFEQLEVDTEREAQHSVVYSNADKDDAHAPSPVPSGAVGSNLRASVQESAPSANRTKFFDLVVPMVPFLTHRSARDLLAKEFATSPLKPSPSVINLVGGDRALTDMRLIRNIRNEFEIYRASVLSDDGLQGLTADRLFAMMVYKNTHLEDFEAIRLGTSQIDAAHGAFRRMVEYQAGHQAALSKEALREVGTATPWDERAAAVGQRLQQVLPILQRSNRYRYGNEPQLITDSGTYLMSELISGDFWRRLHESRGSIEVGHAGHAPTAVSFDELMMLAGDSGVAMKDAVDSDLKALRRRSREALETKDFVSKASLAELMARPDLKMPLGNGAEKSLREIVSELVSPLACDLLSQGLLDENFTLYCSDYQGVAISVSAMNFILHCVQANQSDPLFRFDEPGSIAVVEREVGDRFLRGESVFSVEVFDHYLRADHRKLGDALDRLVARATGSDTSFIDLYLDDATAESVDEKRRFVALLTRRWPGVFVHLVNATEPSQRSDFINAAIKASSAGLTYATSDELVDFIEGHYPEMGVFTEIESEQQASNLAGFLRGIDVQVSDLAFLGEAQRKAIAAAGLYPVTRANLLSALVSTNDGDASEEQGAIQTLALDAVKAHSEVVYDHLIRNLRDYLDAIGAREPTIEKPDSFTGVISDIAAAPATLVQSVAAGAAKACVVADLADLDERAWPPVVASDRITTSASNVARYVDQHGVTPEIARCLVNHDLVETDGIDEEAKTTLAYAIVDAEDLSGGDRVRVVGQLSLTEFLDPARFGISGLALVPDLLEKHEVPDDAETYVLVADRPFSFRERYFEMSTDLADYVTELALTSDDLNGMMKSPSVSHAVKVAMVGDDAFVAARLSRQVSITICDWALKGNDLSVDQVLALSKARPPAEKILMLLEPHLSSIAIETLDSILLALGDDYQPLTRLGRHRPRLKTRPGTTPLLDELKRRNRVSSYGPSKFGGGIRVNMRQ